MHIIYHEMDDAQMSFLQNKVAELDTFRKEIANFPVNNFAEAKLKRESLISSICYSLSLSGIPISLKQGLLLLDHANQEGIPKETAIAFFNYKKVVDYTHAYYDKSATYLSHQFIKNFNATILFATDAYKSAGEYRSDDLVLHQEGYTPCPCKEISQEMDKFLETYNGSERTLHPLLTAANLYLDFMAITPFSSGNGRTCRALILLYLYKNNYALGTFFSLEKALASGNRQNVYTALHGSLTGSYAMLSNRYAFTVYFLKAIEKALHELYAKLQEEKVLYPAEVDLTPKDKAILAYLKIVDVLRIAEYARQSGIGYAELSHIMSKLKKLGYVKRQGMGKSTRYVLRKLK